VSVLAPLDSLGMRDAVFGLPDQLDAAVRALHRGVAGLPGAEDYDHVVFVATGGSGVAAQVTVAGAAPESPVPLLISDDYELPGYVGPRSLVIAASFSGNTAETVDVATDARETGAHIVTISNGGSLAELAAKWGTPHISVPDSLPMPRAAVGALVAPMVLVLDELGLYPTGLADLNDAVVQLRARRTELLRPGNMAQALARRIGRTFPLVYGGGPIGTVAALRWKSQVNLSAKAPSWSNNLPALAHDEVAGWAQHGDVTRQVMTLVMLRTDHEHPAVSAQFGSLEIQLLEVVAGLETVQAEGDGALAQLFDLVLIGDVVSLELAAIAGVDPGPVPAVEAMRG
jgi:glucose/mannose-6-phosphate isomerase